MPSIVDNELFLLEKYKIIDNSITAHIYRDPIGTVIVKLTMWWHQLVKITCEYMLP